MQIELLNTGTNPHGFQIVPETTFEARWLETLIEKMENFNLRQGIWFPISNKSDRNINNLQDYKVSVA